MNRHATFWWTSLLVSSALFLLAIPFNSHWLWGVNHLDFLPTWCLWAAGAVVAAIITLIVLTFLGRGDQVQTDEPPEIKQQIPTALRLAMAIGFGAAFYFLQGGFGLLGDGISIVSEFSKGSIYYNKITEFGSYWLTRQVLGLVSSSDDATPLAFRIVSAISGVVTVFSLLSIVGLLVGDIRRRVVFGATLLISGSALLFCGYIEFYAPVWAASTAFIFVALRYFATDKGKTWVIVAWAVACVMHLVALVFAPAVAYLLLLPRDRSAAMGRQRWLTLAGVTVIGFVGAFLALRISGIGIENIILPLFSTSGKTTPYGIFAPAHLTDIGNLIFLVYPGILCLMAALHVEKKHLKHDRTAAFLVLCAGGSLLFLCLVNPALGMARDWDLMSITLFAPVILVLYWLAESRWTVGWRAAAGYAVLTLLATGMFVLIYQEPGSAADRQLTLLKRYGDKDRGGWTNLVRFNEIYGYGFRQNRSTEAMDRLFPNYRLLRIGALALRNNDLRQALSIGQQLVAADSTQGDFLQFLGAVYRQLKDFPQAEQWYTRAAAVKPHYVILYELGAVYLMENKNPQAYDMLSRAHVASPGSDDVMELLIRASANVGQLDRAKGLVDSLVQIDSTSAPAHLLGVEICLQRGDTASARGHYQAYAKYGRARREYPTMQEKYKFLQ